jgi:hypothetical protein
LPLYASALDADGVEVSSPRVWHEVDLGSEAEEISRAKPRSGRKKIFEDFDG